MKPIRLVIKGINSFEDAQVIDFEKLTSRGIFGIFGPTGSGKSSILDGMTLALYGDVARGSSNFINVNMDKAAVEFTFMIREGEPRYYCVSRSFRRDKKTEGMRTESARLLEWKLGEGKEQARIAAEQKVEVDKECRRIMGLSKDDFFRTVVLPQGKFSEFLKLEGAERSRMLERLFHLERYGEILTNRAKRHQNQLEGEQKEIQGQMGAYGEVSPEHIRQLEQEKADKADQLNRTVHNHSEAEAEKNRLEQLKKLQEELTAWEEKRKQQEDKETFMEEMEKSWKRGDQASRLYGFYQEKKRGEEDSRKASEAYEAAEHDCILLKKETEKQRETAMEAAEKAEKRIPALELGRERIAQAVWLQKEIGNLVQETDDLKKKEDGFLEIKKQITGEIEELKPRLAKEEEVYRQALEQQTSSFLSQEEQQKIDRGMDIFKEALRLKQETEKAEEKLLKVRDEKEEEEKLAVLAGILKKQEAEKEELEKKTAELKAGQIAIEILMEKQNQWKEAKKEQDTKAEYEAVLLEKQKELLDTETTEKVYQKRYQEAEKQEKLLEAEYEQLYEAGLARELSKRLEEGKPCPVCGSIHHQGGAIFQEENQESGKIEQVRSRRDQAREAVDKMKSQLQEIYTGKQFLLTFIQEQQQKIAALDADKLAWDLEAERKKLWEEKYRQDSIKEQLEAAEIQIRKMLEEAAETNSQLQVAAANLENLRRQKKELQQEVEEKKKQLADQMQKLQAFKKETNIEDCQQAWQEKQQKNRIYEKASKEAEQIRKHIEQIKTEIGQKEKELSEAGHQAEMTAQLLSAQMSQLQEKKQQFQEKMEGQAELSDQLEEKQKALEKEIISLKEAREESQKSLKDFEKKLEDKEKIRESLKEKKLILETKSEELKNRLEDAMKKEQIQDAAWIEENYRPEGELLKERQQLDHFYEELKELQVKTDQLRAMMKGQKLLPGQWEEAREKEADLKAQVSRLQTELGHVNGRLEKLLKDWEILKELQKRREVLEHKTAVVNDLLSLLKGKQFVNFIARYYLEYISIEANHRLKGMTGGTYGLEIGSQGRFMIRDYKNGGILRDATTLSGGETFMASLALALALSAQIQLKGAAPLELFFLDEGFGTLDEKYLDVVMSSLEKIYNDRLHVGLISHVEDIKDRIGVRLMVTPAEMGKGGSKVKVEFE